MKKEIEKNQDLKKGESLLKGIGLLPTHIAQIEIFGVTPDGNWDNPGYWGTHEHKLKVNVYNNDKSEESILGALKSGDFEIDFDATNCDIDKAGIFIKDKIANRADGCSTLTNFIKDLQDDVEEQNCDWYRENYELDPDDEDAEDAWNGDGINDEALNEIIWDLKRSAQIKYIEIK